jgi:hypothetical protein
VAAASNKRRFNHAQTEWIQLKTKSRGALEFVQNGQSKKPSQLKVSVQIVLPSAKQINVKSSGDDDNATSFEEDRHVPSTPHKPESVGDLTLTSPPFPPPSPPSNPPSPDPTPRADGMDGDSNDRGAARGGVPTGADQLVHLRGLGSSRTAVSHKPLNPPPPVSLGVDDLLHDLGMEDWYSPESLVRPESALEDASLLRSRSSTGMASPDKTLNHLRPESAEQKVNGPAHLVRRRTVVSAERFVFDDDDFDEMMMLNQHISATNATAKAGSTAVVRPVPKRSVPSKSSRGPQEIQQSLPKGPSAPSGPKGGVTSWTSSVSDHSSATKESEEDSNRASRASGDSNTPANVGGLSGILTSIINEHAEETDKQREKLKSIQGHVDKLVVLLGSYSSRIQQLEEENQSLRMQAGQAPRPGTAVHQSSTAAALHFSLSQPVGDGGLYFHGDVDAAEVDSLLAIAADRSSRPKMNPPHPSK